MTYLFTNLQTKKLISKKALKMLIMSILGFYLCLLFIYLGVHPIISSALVGLLCSLPLKLFDKSSSAIMYCSSFAAIGALEIHQGLVFLLIIPLLVWLLYRSLELRFIGFGGKLGTVAFIGTGVFYLLVNFL